MTKLTVIDLFCGAGGFSEGFKEMGFDIVYALDNWKPATDTIKENHPETEVVKGDITEIEPSGLPHADVIIGGPPCTEFSYSKKGGGGDIKKGMVLVSRFLYFVQKMKPRWWIMENVPRLLNTLPQSIPLKKIGIDKEGSLDIPRRMVMNSADFGAPQKRLRLLSGKYPVPKQTHSQISDMQPLTNVKLLPWVFMRKIIEGLPNPLGEIKHGEIVQDPNYDFLKISQEKLPDHFMNSVMTDEEALKNKNSKMHHAWYGKMKFPDDLDRPSRTVMATQFNASRETMVIEIKEGKFKGKFRKPTIRECACLQAFPITYLFNGSSSSTTKYKLVGNAVPVKLSSALAKAMLEEAKLPIPKKPIIEKN